MAREILALLDRKGPLDIVRITEILGPFGLFRGDRSFMQPGTRHPRYRLTTVSLSEVRNVLRVLYQLDLVSVNAEGVETLYKITTLGKKLLSRLSRSH